MTHEKKFWLGIGIAVIGVTMMLISAVGLLVGCNKAEREGKSLKGIEGSVDHDIAFHVLTGGAIGTACIEGHEYYYLRVSSGGGLALRVDANGGPIKCVVKKREK